jgi:hydrogenase-4 component B
VFKGLLFLAAGATIHRTGTREIDRLGGLAVRMPWTAAAFLCGAVAISGLPPLNGFVSELLTYLGLFDVLRGPGPAAAAAAAIPALAMTGAMALLCFVKVFGAVYLGTARSEGARNAREAELPLLVPMGILAAACAAIGLLPSAVAPALQAAVDDWLPAGASAPTLAALAPFTWISAVGAALLAAGAGALVWLRRRRTVPAPAIGTWDCGFLGTTSSVQYTAASFAQMFVTFTRQLLRPRTRQLAGSGLFPQSAWFHSDVPDLVLDRLLLPVLRGLAAGCNWLRLLQRGRVQVYLLYVFLTLLVLLLLK